jgi:hypothetical protein
MGTIWVQHDMQTSTQKRRKEKKKEKSKEKTVKKTGEEVKSGKRRIYSEHRREEFLAHRKVVTSFFLTTTTPIGDTSDIVVSISEEELKYE